LTAVTVPVELAEFLGVGREVEMVGEMTEDEAEFFGTFGERAF
jgi:hypothetical protein